MRRTTFHRASLAVATLLLLAGCGSQSGGGDKGSGAVSPSPTASSPSASSPSASSPGTASPSASTGCDSGTGELTAADNGRTVCLAVGGQLRLGLDGSKQRPWKAVTATGSALKATNSGIVLQPGDASAAYDAVAAGTATLSSSRPLCAQPTAPGQVSCKAIEEWHVTVRVS
ncbi:hypothetical protein ACGF3G_03650 [Streptomyces sp. NPDC048179]|uniref:hypothetical protein n=1 Tax=Streptomyces sp. NPDC048179 TaxID=3365506 RepID=UPI00372005B1